MRKAAALAAALLVAYGALFAGSPEDARTGALCSDEPARIVQTAQLPGETPDGLPAADSEDGEGSKRSFRSRLRALWQGGGRLLFQLLVAWPCSLLCKGLAALPAAVGTGVLLPVLRFLLGEVGGAFVMFLLILCLLWKAVFPDRSLREFLTKRNLLWIFLVSVFAAAARAPLQAAVPESRVWFSLLRAAVLLFGFCFLWWKTFRLRGPFGGWLRRFLRSPRGLALLLLTAGGCLLTAWAQTCLLSERTAQGALFGAAAAYLLCAAAAFAIFRRNRAMRLRRLQGRTA